MTSSTHPTLIHLIDKQASSSRDSVGSDSTVHQTANFANQTQSESLNQEGHANTKQSTYYTSAVNQPQSENFLQSTESENHKNSSTSGYKLRYNYTMEVEDVPQSKLVSGKTEVLKQLARPLLNEEDINVTLPNAMNNYDSGKDSQLEQMSKEAKDGFNLSDSKLFAGKTDKTKQRKRPLLDEEDINVTLPNAMVSGKTSNNSYPKQPTNEMKGNSSRFRFSVKQCYFRKLNRTF